MRGKRTGILKGNIVAILLLEIALLFFANTSKVKAITVNDTIFAGNPYVSLSPSGTAFTVGYRDTSCGAHGDPYKGYSLKIFGNLGSGSPGKGQHLFSGLIKGRVPVGYWKVTHPFSCCQHSADWYDLSAFGLNRMGATTVNCGREYNGGWTAYCAYCGEQINIGFMYMTVNMAASLRYLPSGTSYSSFFYLCPYDNSLEVTGETNHICKRVSNNRYRVNYNSNGSGVTGSMSSQYFYYGNSDSYNGSTVSAPTNLAACGFKREGFYFMGWSSKPGGDVLFTDKDSWLNVQNKFSIGDYADNTTINLYAVWKPGVSTARPQVTEGENVYVSNPSLVYVRADGITPFSVSECAYLNGETNSTYMVNNIRLYENALDGAYHEVSVINCPDGEVAESGITDYRSEGVILEETQKPSVTRSGNGKFCTSVRSFLVPTGRTGEEITIIPGAMAKDPASPTGERLSTTSKDLANSVKIIFDGEKPVISGLKDYLDIGKYVLDESETGGFPEIIIKAEDLLSGVDTDDFYVRIDNLDNGSSRVWRPDAEGNITVSFGPEEAEKYFYFGDFEITVHVSDRVGNVSEEKVSGWGFDLKTEIKRLLEEKDGKTVFARGESGDLVIKTYGYAEKVEVIFPDELSEYSTVFDYTGNEEYEKDEVIRFMIPLYDLPEDLDSFTVTVIARKDGETLESHPRINLVGVEGTVLDELRTSLR